MSGTCKTNGIRKSTKFWSKNLQETCLVYITVNGRITLEQTLKESVGYHQAHDMARRKAIENKKINF